MLFGAGTALSDCGTALIAADAGAGVSAGLIYEAVASQSGALQLVWVGTPQGSMLSSFCADGSPSPGWLRTGIRLMPQVDGFPYSARTAASILGGTAFLRAFASGESTDVYASAGALMTDCELPKLPTSSSAEII